MATVYKISKEKPLIFEDFGQWSVGKGLVDLRTTRILSQRRRNLQGHQFKGSAVFTEEDAEKYLDLDDIQCVFCQ